MRNTDKGAGAGYAPVFMPAGAADRERFDIARVRAADRIKSSIGTLNEKSLHAALKLYYEERPENHEVRIGEHIADIVGENGIIEIQTRELFRLKKKLRAFLDAGRVTVVYPLEERRTVEWADPDSGEIVSSRRSPKRTGIIKGLSELYGIREFLDREDLCIRFPVLETRHIKLLDGYGKDRKIRSTRVDILPESLLGEFVIRGREDYKGLLPGTEDCFTADELAKAHRTDRDTAGNALRVLCQMGAVQIAGNRGRKKLYRFMY